MHVPINVKSPNNTSKWQMEFNSAFKGLSCVWRTLSYLKPCIPLSGASCSTVGWGTALHAGRSRVWFLMVSLEFFIDIILLAAVGLTQLLTEMSTRNITWRSRQPVRRTDNLTNFMWRLSWYLGASTSWNPLGLSRPVIGLHTFIYREL
jgi:hypothetical protein